MENTLKKLYDIDIECIPYLNIKDEKVSNNNKYYPYYFVEKNGKVSHFIFINAFTENLIIIILQPFIKFKRKWKLLIQEINFLL